MAALGKNHVYCMHSAVIHVPAITSVSLLDTAVAYNNSHGQGRCPEPLPRRVRGWPETKWRCNTCLGEGEVDVRERTCTGRNTYAYR